MGGKRGRPQVEFDLPTVEKLAALQCTDEEIATFFDVARRTITSRKKNDREFLRAYEKGRDGGKVSLRRAQWKSALGGNVTMMIWLGKQHLGQTEKTQISGGEDPIEIIQFPRKAKTGEEWAERWKDENERKAD